MLPQLIVLLYKTVPVSDPLEELKNIQIDVNDPAYLEYLDFKSEKEIPERTGVFPVIVIFAALFLMIYQIVLMYRNHREITKILNQSAAGDRSKIRMVQTFYEDTHNLFLELEGKAKWIKEQYRKADQATTQIPDLNNIKTDFEFIKDRWLQEYNPIINCTPLSAMQIKAELTMAKGTIDKELNIVQKHMREDELSLRDVERDVNYVKNRIGK